MILVTGGTGLVGAHLLLHLIDNQNSIRATYRNHNSIDLTKQLFATHQKEHLFSKIEWIEADITDIPALTFVFENVDYVYHCAGLISFDPKDENKLRKTNIEGTANIVNLCIDFQVKKLCHVSSIAALGDLSQNETVVSENSEWNPEIDHSDYAISKYGAELEVWRGFQEGLSVVIVNPGVILGSTIWATGSGSIISKVKNGLSFYTKGQTGFVGVNDVVTIMVQLMQSQINGKRFSIVSENNTYEYLLKSIASSIGRKPARVHVKPWMTSVSWRLDWFLSAFLGKKRMLSKHAATSLHSVDEYSNEKIKNALNYEFQSIESVIKDIV